MKEETLPTGTDGIGKRTRQRVRISSNTLVVSESLPGCGSLPLVLKPAAADVQLLDWARANHDFLEGNLLRHGAILFRGFNVGSMALFERFAELTSRGGLLDYVYGSTPRHRIAGSVYTSTEYPADQVIPFHNEMSYSRSWPMKIWFCCLKAAPGGGATPIADSARVFEMMDPEIRALFAERGVMYVRNYGAGPDLSYRQVFGTENRDEIEKFCRNAEIEYEWKSDGGLRTRQKCQAIAVHPVTGQTVWFNQAHLFHISSLNPALSEELLAEFGEEGLPRNAYYGDGARIEAAVLERVREAYGRARVEFPWEEGDILMLDNMLVAHGRSSYQGERKVVVAMAEQHGSDFPVGAVGETQPSASRFPG
jgi:alpha-ketoglutarate-dependent taurine dioxygenase